MVYLSELGNYQNLITILIVQLNELFAAISKGKAHVNRDACIRSTNDFLILLNCLSANLPSTLKDSRWRRRLAKPFSYAPHYLRGGIGRLEPVCAAIVLSPGTICACFSNEIFAGFYRPMLSA